MIQEIYNPKTGKYYEVRQRTKRGKEQIKGLWSSKKERKKWWW